MSRASQQNSNWVPCKFVNFLLWHVLHKFQEMGLSHCNHHSNQKILYIFGLAKASLTLVGHYKSPDGSFLKPEKLCGCRALYPIDGKIFIKKSWKTACRAEKRLNCPDCHYYVSLRVSWGHFLKLPRRPQLHEPHLEERFRAASNLGRNWPAQTSKSLVSVHH